MSSRTWASRFPRVLQERDFRLLLGAQAVAQAADGLAQAAFAKILVLDPLTQDTPAQVLRVFAVTLLPYSLIAPFIGVFVDRWRRREIMVSANVARAAVLLLLAAGLRVLPGNTGVYLAALVLLGLGRLFLTTKSAVLPVLLHEHDLLEGNSLSSGGGMVAALAGGGVGLVIVGTSNVRAAFVVAAIAYAVAAWTARRIGDPLAHPHPSRASLAAEMRDVGSALAEGIVSLMRNAQARIALAAIFILRTIGMFAAISAILVIKREFGAEELGGRVSSSVGVLAAAGVGAFLGAVTAPYLGRYLKEGGLTVLGYLVSGIALATLGGIVNVYAVAGLMLLGGIGGFLTKVAVDASLQEAVPDDHRGRAFAVYDILYNAASVLAAGSMVVFFDISFRTLMVGAGIATLLAAAAMGRALERSGLPLRGSPRASSPVS